MLDDALLSTFLMCMPLADVDILARVLDTDPTTIRRHLAQIQQDGYVGTITPPTVGPSVSDLYYLTAAGLRARNPAADLTTIVQLARIYNCDLLGLCKQLPHVPERLTLYDMMIHLFAVAKTAIPAYLSWANNAAAIVDLHLIYSWVYDPVVVVAEKHFPKDRIHHVPLHVHLRMRATFTVFARTETRWWSIGIGIDDGMLTEDEMKRRVRTLVRYHMHESLYGRARLYVVILTSSWPRYQMWRRAALRVEERFVGVVVYLPREHGWPYTSGGAVQEDASITAISRIASGAEPGVLEELFYSSDDVVEDLAPKAPAPVVAELHRRYFAPENQHKSLSEWLSSLARQDYVGRIIQRALYSLQLPQRTQQVLVIIATAPLISYEDLGTLFEVQPTRITALVKELVHFQLVEKVTIAVPLDRQGIPGYDGHVQHKVVCLRATHEALTYLNQVYHHKLAVWHRERTYPPIHDVGVIRSLTLLSIYFRQSQPRAFFWWQIGPKAALSFNKTFGISARQYLFPDAHGIVVTQAGTYHRFWLEYDNGTESLQQLTTKFQNYADYVRSVSAYEEYDEDDRGRKEVRFNLVVIVAPGIQQERVKAALFAAVGSAIRGWRIYALN